MDGVGDKTIESSLMKQIHEINTKFQVVILYKEK
jgi:hypothetical protein